MKVLRLSMRNYRDTVSRDVNFTNMTLISGANGKGKSSVYDAIAFAVWGRTIYRDSPVPAHHPDATTAVEAEVYLAPVDRFLIVQRKTGGTKALFAGVRAPQDAEWTMLEAETQTKLQARIEEYVGSFDAWRRTCVFVTEDIVTSFAAATDAARKEILESLLDVTYLDDLADKAKAASKRADTAHQTAQRKVTELSSRVKALSEVAAPTEDQAELQERAKQLAADVQTVSARIEELRKERKGLDDIIASASYGVQQLKKAATLVAVDGTCVTCGQDITAGNMAHISDRLEQASEALVDLEAEHNPRRMELKLAEDEAWRAVSALNAELGSLAERARAVERSQALSKNLTDTLEALAEAEGAVLDAATKSAGAALLSEALGKKGVRASMLRDVARALGVYADHHLRRLSEQLTTSFDIDESGTSVLSIVDAHGSVRVFKSFSQGQRRRIAVAFLLAQAELNAVARDATLIIDEAFDGLDAAGMQGVIDVVTDMAEHRPLIILTHIKEILSSIPATTHIHIE